MSDRTIDPTRQGISHEPEQDGIRNAAPVALGEAVARVSSWQASQPRFGLHRISEALSASLAAAIGCRRGDWTACLEYPWEPCCAARRRAMGAQWGTD